MSALTTAAAVIALVATAAYFAGVVPGVPKTLPAFVRLVSVTLVLFVAATVAWIAALATE
ncbi:hypothetical protein [Haloplanus salilacus]|uniref:hypothetical protein n=1 Tax=Haloplanus salilacus TaxID=2949994 RepID=UPI0030CBCB0C